MKIFQKTPLLGTELRLNKPIYKLRLKRLINRQDAKYLKTFKKNLSQDGMVGGVINVKIKKAMKLTGHKPRVSIDIRSVSPNENYGMNGYDVFQRGEKDKIKAKLDDAYGWYKTICGNQFRRVLKQVKEEAYGKLYN